jgi:hypothetical protein
MVAKVATARKRVTTTLVCFVFTLVLLLSALHKLSLLGWAALVYNCACLGGLSSVLSAYSIPRERHKSVTMVPLTGPKVSENP